MSADEQGIDGPVLTQVTRMHHETRPRARAPRSFLWASIAFILLHAFFMLFRYGHLPAVPLVPDEVVINDPAISLSEGHGFVAESLAQSKYGLDHLFAHFPPVYPFIESLAFRAFGVSVYSLRLTTTVMSIASTILLLLLVWRLCAGGWLAWSAGLLIQAVYCTNASFVSLERMARMESMIACFSLVSLGAIVCALTARPGERTWPWTLIAVVFAASTMAVHPEAITVVIILGPMILFVVPAKPALRAATAALLVLVPVVIGLAVYGTQIFAAARQFLKIAHDSTSVNPTSYQWLTEALHNGDISAVNRNAFLAGLMVLLAIGPTVYLWRRKRMTAFQRQFAVWFAISCTVDFLLMIFGMRMDVRRCQFLFGILLVGDAICLWGHATPRVWQSICVWLLVAVQCAAAAFYLSARVNRIPEMNPERYMGLIAKIPPGVSIGAVPGLWLNLKESHRPFTLILYGLDGENVWIKEHENPMQQFDVVVLENYYYAQRGWLRTEALQGRTEHDFRVGSHVVSVYTRPNVHLLP